MLQGFYNSCKITYAQINNSIENLDFLRQNVLLINNTVANQWCMHYYRNHVNVSIETSNSNHQIYLYQCEKN